MPKIYRVMKVAEGKPSIEEGASTLSARVPRDISADSMGLVQPGTGGVSVSESMRDLPSWFVPKRLRELVPEARGSNSNFVWSMGQGPFADGAVAARLLLRREPTNLSKGFVEPDTEMALQEYQEALRATRDAWAVDEE